MTETNNLSSTIQNLSRRELRDLVRTQLQMLLEAGDLQGAKAILVPMQPADISEAIEGLPKAMHALAFRLLFKDEAIKVYEYLDYSVQERLIEELKSQEVRDIVDQMSPDDQASNARRKSKIKSQKSKLLWNGLFRDFKWLLYLCRRVLGYLMNYQQKSSIAC